MARLVNMFMVLIALQAAMFLYYDSTPANTVLWEFIMDPTVWTSGGWLSWLVGLAVGIGLVGIAASAVFGFKTDFLVLAPMIGSLMSIGVVFAQLWLIVRNEIANWMAGSVFTPDVCSVSSCAGGNFFASIIVGPMALFYIWTVFDYWRGRDN